MIVESIFVEAWAVDDNMNNNCLDSLIEEDSLSNRFRRK